MAVDCRKSHFSFLRFLRSKEIVRYLWGISLRVFNIIEEDAEEKNRGHQLVLGNTPKVNVIACLEFELAYNDVAVHHFCYYATRPQQVFVIDDSKEEIWGSF